MIHFSSWQNWLTTELQIKVKEDGISMMCMISTITLIIAGYLFTLRSASMILADPNLAEYHLKKSHELELKPMFVMNHGSQVNEGNVELKNFYDNYNLICGNTIEKYASLLKTVNNYVQRYVSLFLMVSGISDQEGKDSGNMITVDLEITISPEDLAYLQNFSKMSKESTVLRDLSRLDDILSKAVRRKETSYFKYALRFSSSLLYYLGLNIHYVLFKLNFYGFLPFLTILLVTWFIYCFSSRKSLFIYLSIIINSMIFYDSFTLYRRKLKDAEIELETLKQQIMSEECDPANTRWYHSFKNIFFQSKCLEYYKNMNRNHYDEVSLFQSILDTYIFYAIRTPFKVLGASIRDFTGEISALWPKPLQWFVNIPLVPFIVTLVAILILILCCKKRLKLSFFGASVEIGDSTEIKETRIINQMGPRLIASYRRLRILGKNRFLRRSEIDLVKETKPKLEASKLECATHRKENDDVQPSTASDGEIVKK